jgi:hypothetical protein
MPNGDAQLDIRPDGLNWQWSIVPADRARQALACALAAISGGWKLYLSLPDDPTSDVLEIIGLSRTRDRPEPPLLYQSAAGIGGYDLRGTGDQAFAFDYDSSGKLDHLVLYRPGTGTIWILKNSGGAFSPVYQMGSPGSGIGGYNLGDPADRAFAFDYDSSGKLDHLVLYRPGTGTIWILKNSGGAFSPVYQMGAPGSGIGGYDLADPADQAFAFDYDITGKLDHLVLYRPGHNTIWILRNNAGTFEAVYRSDTGIRGYDLADPRDRAFAFDYNSNRRLDNLVLYRPGTGMIWILNSLV